MPNGAANAKLLCPPNEGTARETFSGIRAWKKALPYEKLIQQLKGATVFTQHSLVQQLHELCSPPC